MQQYNDSLKSMRDYITQNNLQKEYKNFIGKYLSKSNKSDVKRFLNSLNTPNKSRVPKINNFTPDPEKLSVIRERVDTSRVVDDSNVEITHMPEALKNLPDYDLEDKEVLMDIIGDNTAATENIGSNNNDSFFFEQQTEERDYEFVESFEIKCSRLADLYPQMRNIANSKDFEGSQEKYIYMETHINRHKSNSNLSNYFFMLSAYIESNEIVNNYVKLEGYTNQLLKRKQEIELCLEELKIKYMDEIGDMLDMPVEARLAMVFLETALATHMMNLAALNKRREELMRNHN